MKIWDIQTWDLTKSALKGKFTAINVQLECQCWENLSQKTSVSSPIKLGGQSRWPPNPAPVPRARICAWASCTVIIHHLFACMLSCFSHVRLFATLWTIACQAALSMGFSRQEYWSGLPCPSPGDLPNPGIEPVPLMSPALAGGFFTTSDTWEAPQLSMVPS